MHFSPREKKLPQSVNSNYTSTQATAGYLYTRTSTHNNQVDVATHTHTHEFCPHFSSHCSGHRPCEAEAMSRGWQRWRWSAHHVFSSFCICNISQVRCKIQWWLWKVQSSFGEGCHFQNPLYFAMNNLFVISLRRCIYNFTFSDGKSHSLRFQWESGGYLCAAGRVLEGREPSQLRHATVPRHITPWDPTLIPTDDHKEPSALWEMQGPT